MKSFLLLLLVSIQCFGSIYVTYPPTIPGQGGVGNVITTPGSVVDNCVVRWDGTTGLSIQDSLLCISDLGVVTGATKITVDNISLDGNTISSTSGNLNLAGQLGIPFDGVVVTSGTFTVGSVILDTSGISTTPSGTDLILKGNGTGVVYVQDQLKLSSVIQDSNGNPFLYGSPIAAGTGVNYSQMKGAATGSGPILAAVGTDTNIDYYIQAKGTGTIYTGLTQIKSTGDVDVFSKLQMLGTDTLENIAGILHIGGSYTSIVADDPWVAGQGLIIPAGFGINDSNGNELLDFGITASAINNFKVTNSITGTNPIFETIGGDSSIGMTFLAKGGAAINMSGSKISSIGNGASATDAVAYGQVSSTISDVAAATDQDTASTIVKRDAGNGFEVSQILDSAGRIYIDGANRVLKDTLNNGQLSWTTAGVQVANVVSSYKGIATEGNGVPAIYKTTALTSQSAAIGSTLLYAVPLSSGGQYEISWTAELTQAATTSSTLGGTNGFQIAFTSAVDAVSRTSPASATSTANTTATMVSGVIVVNAAGNSNINYTMGYTSSGATPMNYALKITLKKL